MKRKENLCKCSALRRPASHFSKCTPQRRDGCFVLWRRRRRKRLSNHPDGIGEFISALTPRVYLEILSSRLTRGRTLLLCLTTSELQMSKQGRRRGPRPSGCRLENNTGFGQRVNCLELQLFGHFCPEPSMLEGAD